MIKIYFKNFLLSLLCILTFDIPLKAQLFEQDFNSSSSIGTYINASSPSSGQFNAIGTSGSNTTWSINANKLRVFRNNGNAGAFVRTTDLKSPAPTSLIVKFDINVVSSIENATTAGTFQFGSGFGTANTAEANAITHTRLGLNLTSGGYSFRDIGATTNFPSTSIATGTSTSVTIVINNHGSTMSYSDPTGGTSTVGNDKIDVWLGTTLAFNEMNAQTPNISIEDFKFTINGGAATIEFDNFLITEIPLSCAAPTASTEGFSTFSTATENSIELEWLDGNGDGRVIKMNTVNSFTNLIDGSNPTASNTYTSGEQVIFNGTGASPIVINGLLPNTTYYFKGYEYCSPDRTYNNSGDTDSITTDVGDNFIYTEEIGYGPFCSGVNNAISVAFLEDGNFDDDFKVQLSDSSGIFSTNLSVNIIGTGSLSPISAIIPSSTPAGSGYRIRVINTDPVTIGNDNGEHIVINAIPTIPTSTVPAPVCEGNSISVTASGSTNATAYTFWDHPTSGNQMTSLVTGNTLTFDTTATPGNYIYYIQGENGACYGPRQEVVLSVIEIPEEPIGNFTILDNPSCGPATIEFDQLGYYFQSTASGTSTDFPTEFPYILSSTGKVYVRAFNGDCWSEAIETDEIVISNPISITAQPADPTIPEFGWDAIFVSATNVTSYQWQIEEGCGWTNISGATSYSYTINSPTLEMDGAKFRAILAGSSPCVPVITNEVSLTVTGSNNGNSIWSNEITGTNLNGSTPYIVEHEYDATYLSNPSLSTAGLSHTSTFGGRYGGNNWPTITTINTSKYLQLDINIAAGESYSIDTFNATFQSSGTGPALFQIRTNQDGFTNSIFSSSHSGTAYYSIPLHLNEVSGHFILRIYAYDADATGGTFTINDFDFIGERIVICTPPDISQQPNEIYACYKEITVQTSSTNATYQWEVKTPSSSSFERIISCTPNTIGGQTEHLTITGTIEEGTEYRVKVTEGNCTIISDTVTYTSQAKLIVIAADGNVVLDAEPCESNGWTYYSTEDLPGQYAFAINWAPSGLISSANATAKSNAEIIVTVNDEYFSNEDNIDGVAYGTYTMRRYWNVYTTTFDEPVNVIFPYLQEEIDEIVDAAQSYAISEGSRYEGFKWFKLDGETFEPNNIIVTPTSVINHIELQDVGSTIEGVQYAQFDGITSFSGGTGATGAGTLTNDPLPVALLYFIGDCNQNQKTFRWATASELNAHYYIVEGSHDGIAFHDIGQVSASGNTTSLKQYELNSSSDFTYYRLKQVDFDGSVETFRMIFVNCSSISNRVNAYYSTQEGIVLNISSTTHKKMNLSLLSISGQVIWNMEMNVKEGEQRMTLPTLSLPKGIYVLSVADQEKVQSTKLTVY